MSRRSQDIPIRPRYGITDTEEDIESLEKQKPRRAISNVVPGSGSQSRHCSSEMASSYSEIPFLAQYAGTVPPQTAGEKTPTEESSKGESSKKVQKDIDDENKNESDYEDDEDDADDDDDDDNDEDDNSKDSSTEAESRKQHKRPNSLQYDSSFPYELDGATSNDSEMRHFAAESPHRRRDQMTYASHNSTPSTSTTGSLLTRHFLQTQQPQIDANVLSDIENEAQYLAASVDNLMENLCNLLHSISSITADNVEVHRNAVNKLTDSMDANIKCMYTIMAKTEEITKSMKPTEQLGQRIREIKRLVDMLESTM